MIWRACKTVVLAAGAACLAACGGGSSTGSGSTGPGGGAGAGGAGGGAGTGGDSSGTGMSTGTSMEPFEGIRCLVDGVVNEWPQEGLEGTKALWSDLDGDGTVSFWAYPQSPPPEIRITIKGGNAPGTYACDADGYTHIWYFTADFGWATAEVNDCTITITESAPMPKDYWVGTFSAKIPPFTNKGSPIVVTEGTFNVRRTN